MTGSATGSAAPAGPLAGSGSVVVVGGGVIGLCLAYYLAEAGLEVDLIAPRLSDLAAADEIFVTSAVRGVVPVAELVSEKGRIFGARDLSGAVALREAFERRARAIAETLKLGRDPCDSSDH